jgi:hypothetical protein
MQFLMQRHKKSIRNDKNVQKAKSTKALKIKEYKKI